MLNLLVIIKYSYPFEEIKKDEISIDEKVEYLKSCVYKLDIEFNFDLKSDAF